MLDQDEVTISCPYCAEPVTLLVDPSAGEQAYVEDCQVCCRPMQVRVHVDTGGGIEVDVRAEDEV